MVNVVFFCSAVPGKLDLHVSDSFAAKVQVTHKVPTMTCTWSIFRRQNIQIQYSEVRGDMS